MYLTLRLDDKPEHKTLENLQKFMQHPRLLEILIYREVSSKTKKLHYQGYVKVEPHHRKWFQQEFNKLFDVDKYPKGSKSTALMKKESYKIYITKGNDRIITHNVSEEDIQQLFQQSYEPKPMKETTKDFEQSFKEFVQKDPEVTNKILEYKWLVERLWEYLGTLGKTKATHMIRYYNSLCYTIQTKTIKELNLSEGNYTRVIGVDVAMKRFVDAVTYVQ
jgi:hypothetical protein